MSHGRARKRYGWDVSAPTGHSSMMLPLNGATYGWPSCVPTNVCGAALGEDQLVVLGDLLREAHAAVAEDAALAVDRDQRRQRQRLLEVALGLDEPRAAEPPAERDVLERALAALVAHRAVERMVDEQELDDRVLGVVDAVGLGVDDHPVLDRRRARRLELGDPLDLDQAHPARADRGCRASARSRSTGSRRRPAWRRRPASMPSTRVHLAAVDRQLDDLLFGAGHSAEVSAPGTDRRARRRPRSGSRRPTPPPRRARALPRSRPRARSGTSRPSSRSASPSRRRERTGSCR